MRIEKHLQRANEIEREISDLDPVKKWALIIEACYGACQHYLAVYCEKRFAEHMDTHKGLIGFLRERGEFEFANLFNELEYSRIGRWYGSKTNGRSAKRALEILEKIKQAGVEK